MAKWFRVELPYATFGIKTQRGVVVETAPIGRWMMGKHRDRIEEWVRAKGGTVRRMDISWGSDSGRESGSRED